MWRICLLRICGAGGQRRAQSVCEIEGSLAAGQSYLLLRSESGALTCCPVPDGGQPGHGSRHSGETVGLLRASGVGEKAWYLVPQTDALAINGITPPLPVMRLEPGAVLSLGGDGWLVAAAGRPEPAPAPPELAERPCPVCGGPLGLAPMVQCACGRCTHLETPGDPTAKEALNCFLAAKDCPDCGREATLRPQLYPEPPEKLLPAAADEMAVE